MLKHFKLSPLTRQLIIFLLVLAILWHPGPIMEPDGRLLVEFADFFSPGKSAPFAPGAYINIAQTINDQQTGFSRTFFILAAIPVAKATWKDPNQLYLWMNNYIPLSRIISKNLRMEGGWILTLKMTPEDYDILQTARQRGGKLNCSPGKPTDANLVFKKPNPN